MKGPAGESTDEDTRSPCGSTYFSPLPSLPRHDVVEVAGLTSFSFGEDDDCRYVMIFKKVKGLSSPTLSAFQPVPPWREK